MGGRMELVLRFEPGRPFEAAFGKQGVCWQERREAKLLLYTIFRRHAGPPAFRRRWTRARKVARQNFSCTHMGSPWTGLHGRRAGRLLRLLRLLLVQELPPHGADAPMGDDPAGIPCARRHRRPRPVLGQPDH